MPLAVAPPTRKADDERVERSELVEGEMYALTEKPPGEPFMQVRYLGRYRKGQVLVRYESRLLAGLEEWVRARRVACAWDELGDLLRDQTAASRLSDVDSKARDPVTEAAISAVMTASGEYTGFLRTWTADPASALRFWARAELKGSPLDHHPSNHEDRNGVWHLSYVTALAASQAYAAAEPDMVDLYLRGEEERLMAEGFLPGLRHNHDLLREWAPAHAVARSWCQRPRLDAVEHEVERLQGLLLGAASLLRRHGYETDARRLERGLRGA